MAADWDRVVKLARISQENPGIAAVLRLHWDSDGVGTCAACTGEYSVPWPCPTVLAIEQAAARPTVLQMLQDMARRELRIYDLPTTSEEPTDGTA